MQNIYHRIAYQQVFINNYTVANLTFIHTAPLIINSLNSEDGKIVKHLQSSRKPFLTTGINHNRRRRNRIVHTCLKSTKTKSGSIYRNLAYFGSLRKNS